MGEYKPEPVEAPHWCTWSGDQIPPSHWPTKPNQLAGRMFQKEPTGEGIKGSQGRQSACKQLIPFSTFRGTTPSPRGRAAAAPGQCALSQRQTTKQRTTVSRNKDPFSRRLSKISIWVLGQAALCALSSTPLASGSVGTGCSVYSQSVPHCAVSEVREEAQETQEESKRPGSVGTEVLHSQSSVYIYIFIYIQEN